MLITLAAAAAAAGAAAAEAPELAEIVVTADRAGSFGADLVQVGTFRGARLIDVPLTVNVVPQELLRAQAATGLYDALRNTAGVSRAQLNGATYDNIAIRGILVENRTSYRLNGMLPVVNLVDLPIENKDRVEVLKGVGALYYGFAPPSGIVNLVTKRADRSIAEFTATVNEYGGASLAADVGGRIGDRVGLRFNGSAGLVEPGIDRFSGERFVAAVAADVELTETLRIFVDVEHVAKDVTEPAALTLLPAAQGRVPAEIPSPRSNFGGENLRYDATATNWLARADWRVSRQAALTLEYGEARTERDRDYSQLEAYGGPDGAGVLRIFPTEDQRYRNRNARAELAAAFDTGPVTHNLIAGGTVNWRFQNGRAGRYLNPATGLPTLGSITVPQSFVSPRDVAPPPVAAFVSAPLHIRDAGLYLTDRASWGPFDLLAGVRYSNYRNATTPAVLDGAARPAARRFEVERWTPSVGLIFKPSRRLSVYGTYIEGLEEGGTAPANTVNAFDVLPPAVTRQYEAGVKAELFAGAILQLAGFRVERNSAFTDPVDNVFKLAGRARYQGIEGNLTGEIGPRLSVYASGQYLDAEIRRSAQADLVGRVPENTPEWTGSLFAEYRPLDDLGLGGGVFYVSERAVDNPNSAFVDGYTLLSASARYTFRQIGRNGLTLQLNADNLTNKRYWSAAGNNLLGVGLPRQVKLTARVAL